MAGYQVEGTELKAMIKLARKGPIGFAFNPGKADSDHYLAMHRKRPGDILGKAAKKEGPGVKVAFGSCSVDGKVLSLSCDKVVPAIAKKIKKYLKSQKVTLNVQVLDPDGNVLESDIEDLPEDPDETVTAGPATEADGGEDVAPPARDEAETADASDIVARIKAAQPLVAAMPAAAASKLKDAMSKVVTQIKSEDLDGARAAMDRIETALKKLGGSDADQSGPELGEQREIGTQADLVARLKVVSGELEGLPSGAAGKLQTALKTVVGRIKKQELDLAATALSQIEAAVRKLRPPDAAPDAKEADAGERNPLVIWRDAKERSDAGIAALQSALKSVGHPELDKIVDFGLNGVTQGNQTAMMKALMDYNSAPEDQKPVMASSLLSQVESYRAFVSASRIIDLCENNPFGVSVSIKAPMNTALDRISRAVEA